MKIIWLDDEPESISAERDIIIPQEIDMSDVNILFYKTINELLESIFLNTPKNKDIFLIDAMLLGETGTKINKNIKIIDELMAGAELYIHYIKDQFPKNRVLIYSSRGHEDGAFDVIKNDKDCYQKTVFVIDKLEKDTKLLKLLKEFIGTDYE